MDHDAVREQLELAAVEPGGLERLMAGDTATAQAVAAHLAGCPSCSAELARLGRAAALVREAVREVPPSDLKARTLAAVRAEGVLRPLVATVPGGPAEAPVPTAPVPTAPHDATRPPAATVVPVGPRRLSRAQIAGWVGTIAAAVVLSIVTTSYVVGSRVDDQLAAQGETIAALEEVTTATLAVTAEPDAERVALDGVSDPSLDGSLVFSPTTAELVVVASGLTEPPAGQEYRCWVEVDGQRQRVGRMFFSDDLAYWVGPVPAVAGLTGPATFGVSLVEAAVPATATDPVLLGEL